MKKKAEKTRNSILGNAIPKISFDCLAWNYRSQNKENKEIVDNLIEKGLSAFNIGKLIFSGHINKK